MALFTFWYRVDQISLKQTGNLSIQREYDPNALATLMNLDEQKIEQRLGEGNEAWTVKVEDKRVSFGWVGRSKARIGELSKVVDIPHGNLYLWNFRTLEPYRGRGYYAQLLRAILVHEEQRSERIWIISAPENLSSYNGIIKAGFQPVGDIMFNYQNEVVLQVNSINQRTLAGANFIQVPITTQAVRPCWRCVSKAMNKEAACDCFENNLPCRCNGQSPPQHQMLIPTTKS